MLHGKILVCTTIFDAHKDTDFSHFSNLHTITYIFNLGTCMLACFYKHIASKILKVIERDQPRRTKECSWQSKRGCVFSYSKGDALSRVKTML